MNQSSVSRTAHPPLKICTFKMFYYVVFVYYFITFLNEGVQRCHPSAKLLANHVRHNYFKVFTVLQFWTRDNYFEIFA